MSRELLTGNESVVRAIRLAEVEYMPAFTGKETLPIIKFIEDLIERGEFDAKMVVMESDHSMITAAGSAAATGVRVFSPSTCEGLLYAIEMMYIVAGWRAPFVMLNMTNSMSSSYAQRADMNDILSARDCGFLQMHCSTVQEILDLILIAYRLAEDEGVRLPIIVNMDGYRLSNRKEHVEIPDSAAALKFVGEYVPSDIEGVSIDTANRFDSVPGESKYFNPRYELLLSAQNALSVYGNISAEFYATFGRNYDAVENYYSDDAEVVFVVMGFSAEKTKRAVDDLRRSGKSVGLLRPRLIRPFPKENFRKLLEGKKGVAVIDQNISMGMGGVLYGELCSSLYGFSKDLPVILSFIEGSSVNDISEEEYSKIAEETFASVRSGIFSEPRIICMEN